MELAIWNLSDMPLTCNIDKRGRRLRMIFGIILDTSGCGLIVAGILMSQSVLLGAGVAACVGGSFMIFEAAAGWCALRAMGFKTKL